MFGLETFPGRKGSTTVYSKKYLPDIYVRAFSNGRIHFGNSWWYFLGEVVKEESADVEERLRHVGTERLILKIDTVKNEKWKV